MTPTGPQVLKATALRDVIAAVPFQCGFHPRRSVVVLSLRGPRKRVGQVTRADLPAAEDIEDAVVELAEFVVRDEGSASMVVVYDEQPWDRLEPPHEGLVSALLGELQVQEVPALDALYVTADRYWSYLCEDPACCPAEGEPVAEARSSPLAAAYVLAGLAPLPDREALVARVHPREESLVAEVAESAWRWLGAYAAQADDTIDPGLRPVDETAGPDQLLRQRTEAAVAVLDQVLPGYLGRSGVLTVDQAGQLIAALQSVTVRDELMLHLNRSPTPDPAAEDAVERMLVDLCVRVEGPLACAPLSVLAWHCWARGEGALARIAVDRARIEDPTYRLAVLLAAALDHGLAPGWVVQARAEDERAGA